MIEKCKDWMSVIERLCWVIAMGADMICWHYCAGSVLHHERNCFFVHCSYVIVRLAMSMVTSRCRIESCHLIPCSCLEERVASSFGMCERQVRPQAPGC